MKHLLYITIPIILAGCISSDSYPVSQGQLNEVIEKVYANSVNIHKTAKTAVPGSPIAIKTGIVVDTFEIKETNPYGDLVNYAIAAGLSAMGMGGMGGLGFGAHKLRKKWKAEEPGKTK